MNRKFVLTFFVLFVTSLAIISCGKSTEDNSINSAKSVENSAKSMENSAKSMENSANSMAESAKSMANLAKSSGNLASSNTNVASSNTNVTSSNANVAKSSSTPYSSSLGDDVTSKRYAECVRQRTAFGADTSPCSEWAKER